MKKISFASDNASGIHPDILQSIIDANQYHMPVYGDDDYTKIAKDKFYELFGKDIEVFFVFNGTGANVTSLSAMNKSYQAVICSDQAHIQGSECGAIENFNGSKLLTVPAQNGKITVDKIAQYLPALGDPHQVQPHAISISQTTELGTVYTPSEILAIAEFAHQHNMLLHMDGARISNAAVLFDGDIKKITKEAGVDVLSYGGTKNGMMLGEAVLFFNQALGKDYPYIRKQGMQLASKMRFISTQFIALLSNNLWLKNAKHANNMAQQLAKQLREIPGITFTQPVESNAIFLRLPQEVILELQKQFYFYVWDETTFEVRLMTSFDTSEEEINEFVKVVRSLLTKKKL